MLSANEVACYFLNKDDGAVFTDRLIESYGQKRCEGSVRLDKYLHIAQLLHIAKYETPLFRDALYAYDSGAAVPSIHENYIALKSYPSKDINLRDEERNFLDKVYNAFRNADLDELIEISCEDNALCEKRMGCNGEKQRVEPMLYAETYKRQYADMLKVIERM